MNADDSVTVRNAKKRQSADPDLEMDFIREFSTGGEVLNTLSNENRRERIRVAIYTHGLPHEIFRGGPMTYAEAYTECFGRPLEMRRVVRDQPKPQV